MEILWAKAWKPKVNPSSIRQSYRNKELIPTTDSVYGLNQGLIYIYAEPMVFSSMAQDLFQIAFLLARYFLALFEHK